MTVNSRVNDVILLVDPDLGFLFWLARLLDCAGYQAFPAKSVADGMALINQLQLTVSLMILNCSLPSAEALIASQRQTHRQLKVISLVTRDEERLPFALGVDAMCHKPNQVDQDSRNEWLQTVSCVLAPNRGFGWLLSV